MRRQRRGAGRAARPASLTVLPAVLSKLGDWTEMGRRIDDGLLELFAVVGEPEALAPEIARRYAGVVDRISFYTPELHLMAETEASTAATPPIAYEYVWFDGQPVAQKVGAAPRSQIQQWLEANLGATSSSSGA